MRTLLRIDTGLLWMAALACAGLVCLHAVAGTERFDYDSLGRLVRHIDPSGTVTDYLYDAVGNILEVRRSGAAGPPTVSNVTPSAIRRRESLAIQITGAQLTGARIVSPDAALDVSGLTTAAGRVSFTLSAAADAALGLRPFTLLTATGSTSFALSVNPALPQITLSPAVVVLAPAGVQEVTLRLSNSDLLAHSITLVAANPVVASVTPAALLLAAGQTEARFSVAAGAIGITRLDLVSATLSGYSLAIHVVAPTAGANTRYAASIGVLRPQTAGAVAPIGPLGAANVGVLRPQLPGVGAPVGPLVAASVGVLRPAGLGTGMPVGPFAAANVGVLRPAAAGTGMPVGPFAAANVGVLRPDAPSTGMPVGPFIAANVGVLRPAGLGIGMPVGPFTAANVGVLRPTAPGSGATPVGPLVAPIVGVVHE